MNDNFKTSERVEYHIYDAFDRYDMYVSFDYNEARGAFRDGDYVYECHITRYTAEWTTVEHNVKYEWHHLDKEYRNEF